MDQFEFLTSWTPFLHAPPLASPIHGFAELARAETALEASTSPEPATAATLLEAQMPGTAVPDQGQQGPDSEGDLHKGASDEVPPSSLLRHHAPLSTYPRPLSVRKRPRPPLPSPPSHARAMFEQLVAVLEARRWLETTPHNHTLFPARGSGWGSHTLVCLPISNTTYTLTSP